MSDVRLHLGDCLTVLPTLEAGSVDAVVTDPPYALSFMGKEWDSFGGKGPSRSGYESYDRNGYMQDGRGLTIAASKRAMPGFQTFSEQWATAALRVLRPGGYLLAFGGTRTFHRLACALEDAGFEMRDCIMWLHAQGFPKGRGCLKPAFEPVLLCRKPGPKVLPLGVDECRVPANVDEMRGRSGVAAESNRILGAGIRNPTDDIWEPSPAGRYPANICHDGSAEVLEAFAAFGSKDTRDGKADNRYGRFGNANCYGKAHGAETSAAVYGDTGTAARFFYCSKAPASERVAADDGTRHPTQKPVKLMEWLVKLVCPEGGVCLDPFMGSGTTGVAAIQTGRRFIGIELDAGYHAIAQKRIAAAQAELPLFAEAVDG